jgi:hypothetical protein
VCAETLERTAPDNKQLRDKQLKSNCEGYRKTIYDCCMLNEQNDITIMKAIQNWARDLEELFMLHDQAWYIPHIAAEIIASLKTVGLTNKHFNYVHEALSVFGDKYVQHIDHSSVRSESKLSNHLEHYYRSNANRFYEAFKLLKSYNPAQFFREDAQKIGELSIDVKEHIVKAAEHHKIPICEPTSDDFEGVEDKFQEHITYTETIPEHTQLSDSIRRHGESWLKVADVVVEEGKRYVEDPSKSFLSEIDIKKTAESFDYMTSLNDPTLDRKWRFDWPKWFAVSRHANAWFKHSASTTFTTMDFKGIYRNLTREQIGARKESALRKAEELIKLLPHYFLFSSIWYEQVRRPRGADFSTRLSPKLSDRSIK